ncbi:MAG: UDP-N-acetylmuramoyl-L-alanine--D-glutamate ligase [Candidatus Binataceae bacterium]
MEIAGKRVMVMGLGVSGLAAARFLARRGAELVLTDTRTDINRGLLPHGEVHLGVDDPALGAIELIVVSPGIARDTRLLRAADTGGIPVIGEMELASRFIRTPIIAITGTNGKSTVTMMIGAMLRAAGMRVFVGGNLGTPLIEAVDGAFDAIVVEASSFQLETIVDFKPHVGVYLNLTDDHFERYRDRAEYGRAKARLFINQGADDWAILNRDDSAVWELASTMRARVMSFGMESIAADRAIWNDGADLRFVRGGVCGRVAMDGFALAGRHNRVNAMAAAGAALAVGVDARVIGAALADFRGLPHRIEFVREKNGVVYIDDSKGTNVGAVMKALEAVAPPIILLAGGVDKGGDYAPLRPLLSTRAKLLVLYGAAREKMRAALDGAITITVANTLAEAVNIAAANARPGDTVMLSPACSSFDQFRDYAERGHIYQELVRAL